MEQVIVEGQPEIASTAERIEQIMLFDRNPFLLPLAVQSQVRIALLRSRARYVSPCCGTEPGTYRPAAVQSQVRIGLLRLRAR